MKILFLLFFIFFSFSVQSELIKPDPNFLPEKVVSIQLNALMNNNKPYNNAGIEQTWEFAHPSNRIFTGPLNNFIKMMKSQNYLIMLNHIEHKIIGVKSENNISYFFVELTANDGNKYGFQWTVKKVENYNEFLNCWMTISVSAPMLISNSA